MPIVPEAEPLFLLAKILFAATLFVLGCTLLWRASRSDATASARPAIGNFAQSATSYVARSSERTQSLPMQPTPSKLKAGSELSRLGEVVAGAKSRLDVIHTHQASAARQLDAAETAFNRLIAEISTVMPVAVAPTTAPRRRLEASTRAAAASIVPAAPSSALAA